MRVARPSEAADIFHERNTGHGGGAAPAVHRESQRLAYAKVVERLLAGIDGQHQAGRPWPFEHDGIILEFVYNQVSVGGSQTSELDVELTANYAGSEAAGLNEIC